MKRFLSLLLFVWLLGGLLVCGACAAGSAYVNGGNADRVHLRANPSAQADSLGLYFTGTPVACESSLGREWVKVRIGAESGYMKGEFLSEARPASREPAGTIHVNTVVNLRVGPSREKRAAASLPDGQAVLIHGETHTGWYYLTANGQTGYVMSQYVQLGQPTLRGLAACRPVLLGQTSFGDVDEHRQRMLETYLSDFGAELAEADAFALADFDGDGADEVIVSVAVNGSPDFAFLLLDPQPDGTVCGCTMSYRAFLDPKADGTFSYASSAAESGIGRLRMTPSGYEVTELAGSDLSAQETIVYRVGGRTATKAAFQQAVHAQEQKPAPLWYAFREENLQALLR